MMEGARFARLWDTWDARRAAGERAADILRAAKDEELVEILAGESTENRKYERDIIATELLNRLSSRFREQPVSADAAADSAQSSHKAAEEGQEAIHRAEGILKSTGHYDLGASVSASADRSLAATQAALNAATEAARSARKSVAQSRAGVELAEEAAQTAKEAAQMVKEGQEITEQIEGTMDDLGRGKEGRAAGAASRAMSAAADDAAEAAADDAADAAAHQDIER